MAEIDLGFPEEREDARWLCNRYFPSKVGGRPAWLELDALPSKEALQCRKCKEPMSFLCQIYAPGEEDYNFHRSLYVFICREPSCQAPNDSLNLAVFRSQLSLKNDFYSEEPPSEEDGPEPEIATKKKLCLVCGCPGPLTCGRCKKSNYCSSKHQHAMWPYHKQNCGQSTDTIDSMPTSASALKKIIFPECEIVIEPNSTSNNRTDNENTKNDLDDDADVEKKRLKEFQDLLSEGNAGTFTNVSDTELEKYAQNTDAVDDKHFRRFKKEIRNEPDQIIRYKRAGAPLWIADVPQTIGTQLDDIPKCELCGATREFEFQIMPQMLLLLKDENLDWGVLSIYTCPNSCMLPKGIGYTREYIIKQDLLLNNK